MDAQNGSLVETLPSLPRDLPSFVQLLLLNVAGTRGVPGGDVEQPRHRLVFNGRQGLRGVEVPSGSAPLGIPFPLFAPADHLRVIGVLEKVNGNAKKNLESFGAKQMCLVETKCLMGVDDVFFCEYVHLHHGEPGGIHDSITKLTTMICLCILAKS